MSLATIHLCRQELLKEILIFGCFKDILLIIIIHHVLSCEGVRRGALGALPAKRLRKTLNSSKP